jgi:hypothetical protein
MNTLFLPLRRIIMCNNFVLGMHFSTSAAHTGIYLSMIPATKDYILSAMWLLYEAFCLLCSYGIWLNCAAISVDGITSIYLVECRTTVFLHLPY